MKWVITILFLAASVALQAQVFKAVPAKVYVTGEIDSGTIGGESHGMYIILNYDRALIDVKMHLHSIITTDDRLNYQIQNSPDQLFHFSGKMKLDYVRTKTHPTQRFGIDGMLAINGIAHPESFNAVLFHIANSGEAACKLSGKIIVDVRKYIHNTSFPGLNKKVVINFSQIVLKKATGV